MPSGVTPAGIRTGEPSALAGLVELRGSAVCAYAGAIAEPVAARKAAAEAMASFRAYVVQAGDLRDLNPDAILLRAVRESSAARAPRRGESGDTLRRLARRGGSACELVPRLLAARANRELSHADVVRLDRHLASCPECRDLRDRFRTAESLYAEGAGTSPLERDARALLVALAGAGPLAGGSPQSIAQEALALLYADTVSPQGPARVATPPSDAPATEAAVADTPPAEAPPAEAPRVAAPPPSPAHAPSAQPRPADPWPGHPAGADVRPARTPAPLEGHTAHDDRDAPQPSGADASADAAPARHGARVGTTPGRVSFGRRTVIIRSGTEPPEPSPEPGPRAEAAAEAEAEADDVGQTPEAQQASPTLEPAVPVVEPSPIHDEPQAAPPSAAPTYVSPGPADGGPGAPPDSGALARVIPGVLIVMAIGIALLIAGIVGADNTPATTDDIDPPGLREPARELDTTDTLRTPPAPGTETAPNAD